MTGVETRFYTGGVLTLSLRGESLARGDLPTTTLTTTYNDLANCEDDQVSLSLGVVMLENDALTASAPVRAVAAALLTDLDGNGVTVAFPSLTAGRSTDRAVGPDGCLPRDGERPR